MISGVFLKSYIDLRPFRLLYWTQSPVSSIISVHCFRVVSVLINSDNKLSHGIEDLWFQLNDCKILTKTQFTKFTNILSRFYNPVFPLD